MYVPRLCVFCSLGSTSFTQASLHPLLRIAARSGSFLLVWSEVHTQHAIQQNLRRLDTPSQPLFVMGPGRKSTVATPSDTDNSTHSQWGGSPLLLSAYVDERYRSALDPKEGISTKARALLQRGTCVNARGVPLFYNRLHFLTKTTAQSTATPLAYDRDHIPPTAQQWVAREAEVRVKIDAAIAAATAAKNRSANQPCRHR